MTAIDPEPSPIERRTIRSQVFDLLSDRIRSGSLAPGAVVRDYEIAQELNVSRTPVREALQMLEQLGAVDSEPGRRTRIVAADPSDYQLLSPIVAALHGTAVDMVADKIHSEAILDLRRLNDAVLRAEKAGDRKARQVADDVFHDYYIKLAVNPYLDMALEPVMMHAARLEQLYFTDRPTHPVSHSEHEHFIDALADGEFDSARRLIVSHFSSRTARINKPPGGL